MIYALTPTSTGAKTQPAAAYLGPAAAQRFGKKLHRLARQLLKTSCDDPMAL